MEIIAVPQAETVSGLKLEEALPFLRAGRKIRRAGWAANTWIGVQGNNYLLAYIITDSYAMGNLSPHDFLADDWIVSERKNS